MGGQVGRAIELLAALGTPVLQEHYAGTAMPGQAEGILELDLAQPAHIVADHILDGRQLGLGLLRDLHNVVLGIDVAVAVLHRPIGDVLQGSDDGARDRRAGLLVELQLARGLVSRGFRGGGSGLAGPGR